MSRTTGERGRYISSLSPVERKLRKSKVKKHVWANIISRGGPYDSYGKILKKKAGKLR